MKKLVFTLFSFLLLVLTSFTENSVPTDSNTTKILYETLIGEWKYDSMMRNGEVKELSSCDKMDLLRFDPSGQFEAVQHITMIDAKTGSGTTTNCNAIKSNGSWSVTNDGKLLRNNEEVTLVEITEATLKIKTVVEVTNAKFEKTTETYVDTYKRNAK